VLYPDAERLLRDLREEPVGFSEDGLDLGDGFTRIKIGDLATDISPWAEERSATYA
jgi:hypothetical protein